MSNLTRDATAAAYMSTAQQFGLVTAVQDVISVELHRSNNKERFAHAWCNNAKSRKGESTVTSAFVNLALRPVRCIAIMG